MFCKHCGKEIDDNSSFCKYCGKSLKDVTKQSEMSFWEKKFLTYLLYFIIGVVVLAIWLYLLSLAAHSLNDESYRLVMNAFRLTALIIIIVFLISRVSFKNRIILFNRSDSPDNKLKKYLYLVYTFIVPFICMLIVDGLIRNGTYEASDIVMYFILFAILWIVPTIAICSKYDKSQSNKKSNS